MKAVGTQISEDKSDLQSPLESVDKRMIGLMRLLLASSALLVTYIDPAQPDRFVVITYSILVLYCVYSGVLYFLSIKKNEWLFDGISHWIDVGWYLLFVSLSYGTGSIFFFFFFFPILVTAFRWGFKTSIRLTIVSAILFTVFGYFTSPSGELFETNRFIIRPIYLIILGYMISYWGQREITFKKRLSLLKQVSKLSNPRFGIDQTLVSIMEKVRAFYDADSFLLISIKSDSTYALRESTRVDPSKGLRSEPTMAVKPLIKLLGNLAYFHECETGFFQNNTRVYAYDCIRGEIVSVKSKDYSAVTDLLDASSFITVPIFQRSLLIGRIFLTSKQNCFNRTDIDFLLQLIEHILPALENVELLDRLASEAVEQQRQKISRDIHDSTIQPYIGLKLGLEALELKCAAGEPIIKDVEKLIRLADISIGDLRSYIKNLKGESDSKPGVVLITAVKQQAIKFQEFYGIKVDVQASDGFMLNDRLAAEAFQIVTEGLSNIKRHTSATSATIKIHREDNQLVLEIENDKKEIADSQKFVPQSITNRAESLGGTTKVEQQNNLTKVSVKIPL